MTADDLAPYSAEWVEPISTTYRDWTVYELPPNGDGIAALEMLNIMEQFPPAPDGPHSPAELHTRIEAMKLAYADVKAYDGDPRFSKIPVAPVALEGIRRKARRSHRSRQSQLHCRSRRARQQRHHLFFRRRSRRQHTLASSRATTGIRLRTSPSRAWASRFRIAAAFFRSTRKSPNALAGRKRPFHTIIPAFMQHGDQHIGFGIMGGMNQPLAHAQFVSNIVDYHMNIQAAMEEPRFTDRQQLGCNIVIESRVTPGIHRRAYEDGPRRSTSTRNTQRRMGRGQAVLHDSATGVNYGASDPRADGAAIPESAGFLANARQPR